MGFLPGALDAFNSPKAAAVVVLGGACGAALLIAWLAARVRREPSARWDPLDLAVLAWVAAAVVVTVFARSPDLAWLGEVSERDGLQTTLALAGLYAATRISHREPGSAERTLDVLLGAAAIAGVYALAQMAGWDPIPWADPTVYRTPAGAVLRPGATLGVATSFGAIAVPALGVCLARVIAGRAPLWRDAPLAALLAATVAATLSRGAWIAALMAIVVAGLAAIGSGSAAAGRRAALALGAVFLATAVVLATRAEPVASRLAEGAAAASGSGATRVLFAHAALAMFRTHPWFGVGLDGFGLAFPAYQSAELWRGGWLGMPGHAHSVALETLATRGTAGVLAGLAWLVALAFALRRRLGVRDPLAAPLLAGAAGLVVAGTFNVVGVAGAAVFAVLSGLAPPPGSPGRSRVAVWVGLLVAIALAARVPGEMRALLDAGLAKAALTGSLRATPDQRPRWLLLADTAGTRATAQDSQDDALWRMAGDAALARANERLAAGDSATAAGCAARSLGDARHALRLVPIRAVNHQRLASALVLAGRWEPGRRDEALREWSEALAAAPADGLMRVAYVRDLLSLGMPEQALVAARELAALYPEAAPGHALEAEVLHVLGRDDQARAALARARAARPE